MSTTTRSVVPATETKPVKRPPFPPPPVLVSFKDGTPEHTTVLEAPAALSRQIISNGLAFASPDKDRPVLNGVHVRNRTLRGQDELVWQATNSYVLLRQYGAKIEQYGADLDLILEAGFLKRVLSFMPTSARTKKDTMMLRFEWDRPAGEHQQTIGLITAYPCNGMALQMPVDRYAGAFPNTDGFFEEYTPEMQMLGSVGLTPMFVDLIMKLRVGPAPGAPVAVMGAATPINLRPTKVGSDGQATAPLHFNMGYAGADMVIEGLIMPVKIS